MSAVKAIFVDMDGTLLDPDSHVSPVTIDVLKKLHSIGVPLIIATGRPLPSVMYTMKECELCPDYMIASNGALVADKTGKILIRHTVDPSVVRKLISVMQQPNPDGTMDENSPPKRFITNIYSGSHWYTDMIEPRVVEALGPSMKPVLVDFTKPEPCHLEEAESVWYISQDPQDMNAMEAYTRATCDPNLVNPQLSLPYLLDTSATGVNKGRAVKEVCEMLKISIQDVAAFGDGMNDLEMLKVVGHPHVMENAQQRLKDALPNATIVGKNTEDGVAKRLIQIFGIQKSA